MNKSLSSWVLMLFITGSIASIRNLPAMAIFGSKLLILYGLTVIGILIPTACITAELSIRRTKSCGVFGWCYQDLGPRSGLLAIWLQWISTMIWYPSILAFMANTLAYLINPALTHDHAFVFITIIAVYWALTFVTCFGVQASARLAATCTVLGMFIPMVALFTAGVLWLTHGMPVAAHMNWAQLWPHSLNWTWLPPLTAAVTTCLGMELIAVYAPKLNEPKRSIPRALMGACPIVIFCSLMGAMTVAIIIPNKQINLIAGTLQAFRALEPVLHSQLLIQGLIAAILIGTAGMMLSWMLSPAEGLRQASHEGLLPTWFQVNNRFEAPQRVLILQAILVTAFSSLYFFVPNFNTVYWYLTDLSTELYILMYVLIFIVAFRSKHLWSAEHSMLNNTWLTILSIIGMTTCALCLLAGFIAPGHFSHLSLTQYALYFLGGMALMCSPVLLFTAKRWQ